MGQVKKSFPPEVESRVKVILESYPTREDALFPLIHLAQEVWGYIDDGVVELLAETMGTSPATIHGVVSFYTMFHRKKPGKVHIRVCTNISCMLNGADELLARLKEKLGIDSGETTPDGRFSLEEAECLGACDKAPVVMVNDDYEGPVDMAFFEKLVEEVKP